MAGVFAGGRSLLASEISIPNGIKSPACRLPRRSFSVAVKLVERELGTVRKRFPKACPERPRLFVSVDIYTCKPFDGDVATDFTAGYFGARAVVGRPF